MKRPVPEGSITSPPQSVSMPRTAVAMSASSGASGPAGEFEERSSAVMGWQDSGGPRRSSSSSYVLRSKRVPGEGVEPPQRRSKHRVLPLDDPGSIYRREMEPEGIEPSSPGCKPSTLPLSYDP